MYVLGLSCFGHDSAACLVHDGKIVAAAEEERFSRRKNDKAFPARSIAFVLQSAGITGNDLAAVVFYEKPSRKIERLAQSARLGCASSESGGAAELRYYTEATQGLPDRLKQICGYDGPLSTCDHALSHAATAFFLSPHEEAAVLVVDGVGEWTSTALYHGKGTELKALRTVSYPHSLGMFYSALTAYIGFEVNEGEYKVMGLAPYGSPLFYDELRGLITLYDDGNFTLDLSYFAFESGDGHMFTPKLVELLGPPRNPDALMQQRFMDIAASLQKVMEEALVALARAARKETGLRHLCLAGGVAHNIVANARLREAGLFDSVTIPFAAGDNGGAIGAALSVFYQLSGLPRVQTRVLPYLGPSYDDEAFAALLAARGLDYIRLSPRDALLTRIAALLDDQNVIGWFQGEMEFGPRALGHRSILASPRNAAMKDILNARVKRREEFRPFAPAVPEDRAHEYFAMTGESPAMLYAVPVLPEKRDIIPAVTHVDGSARVQTVRRQDNALFYDLLQAVGNVSGVPVLINTSFNIRGEPIVCTPEDAIACFLGTDIDCLVLGSCLVMKKQSIPLALEELVF